jgi:hypothetical protein
VLINKEDFGFVSEFLIRWKFNFFGREVNESGLVSGFKRYGVR